MILMAIYANVLLKKIPQSHADQVTKIIHIFAIKIKL